MKKLLGIVSGNAENKKLNESVEECGSMGSMGSSMPERPPVTMSVNLNAQGVDNIKDLLNLMRSADSGVSSLPTAVKMPMPAIASAMPISVTKIGGDEPDMKPAGSDGDRGMAQIRDLIKQADRPKGFENEPEEAYAGIDSVTTDAGGGMQEPKDPADIRVKDPSGYAQAEEYANEPDEQTMDHTTMIKDLSGGLNREKQQYAKAQDGDNAMAVREATIRNQLDALYKEIKEGNMMPDPRSPEEKKLGRDIQDLEMAQKKREYERSPEYAKLKADAEKRRQDSDAETAKWNAEDEAYRKSRGMKPRGVK